MKAVISEEDIVIPLHTCPWTQVTQHLPSSCRTGDPVCYLSHIRYSITCLTPGFNLLTTALHQHSMLDTSKNAIQEAVSNEESLKTGPFPGCNDAEQTLASTFWKYLTELLKTFCSRLYYFLWLTAGVLIMGLSLAKCCSLQDGGHLKLCHYIYGMLASYFSIFFFLI